MTTRQTALCLVALGGGIALGAFCAGRYLRRTREHTAPKSVHEQVDNWENEGGNVPSVPTPTVVPAAMEMPGTP